jgi:hypothetical protein
MKGLIHEQGLEGDSVDQKERVNAKQKKKWEILWVSAFWLKEGVKNKAEDRDEYRSISTVYCHLANS